MRNNVFRVTVIFSGLILFLVITIFSYSIVNFNTLKNNCIKLSADTNKNIQEVIFLERHTSITPQLMSFRNELTQLKGIRNVQLKNAEEVKREFLERHSLDNPVLADALGEVENPFTASVEIIYDSSAADFNESDVGSKIREVFGKYQIPLNDLNLETSSRVLKSASHKISSTSFFKYLFDEKARSSLQLCSELKDLKK